jgi:Fe-S cluster assembly protein SufD
MKVELLKSKKNIKLNPNEDTQYILIPENEVNAEVNLEKEGVAVDLIVPFSLNGKSKANLKTLSLHKAPNTSCDVNIKTALFDSARSEYVGKIIIEKNARQTNSFLHDEVLLIGENTGNNSQPILEIEADDVSASHGATTGRINEDQIYYLLSRGLSRKEAEKTIIEGFFESLIVQIKDEKIQRSVRKKLFKSA